MRLDATVLPRRPDRPMPGEQLAVMVIARELLPDVLDRGLPIPASICDAWFTRDGDIVLLLAGVLPAAARWLTPIFERTASGRPYFKTWAMA